jgi:two-component system sensor histidine kinase/response regulator
MKTRIPKVLIVDDEPRNVRLLEAMVTPLGVEAFTASSGSHALEMTTKVSPDAILLDIMMPGMDGIEVCLRLKKDRTTQNIPVIFVTALTDVQNHAVAVEAGGIGFVTKPIQRLLLEASVRSAIRMKRLSDEVDELMRQRASLTHMIVHDINNLLTINLGFAQLTLEDDTLPSSLREYVTTIEKSSNDIKTMTQSLLEVEKLESGTMPVSLGAVNLWELAEQRMSLLISQAAERGIHLDMQKLTEEIIAQADEDLLARVLDNLIFNAVKFCPDKGSIEINISRNEGMTEIRVTNDGAPIPKEFHERIFEKFAQVEVRQATGRKGVGLGLTFCKMALDAMGGTISVESPVPGREGGTRFVVRLPTAHI